MLSIHQLEFRYQQRRILQGLSFASQAGDIVHIIGPNGAGKTTLISILAGLRREHGGRIDFHTKDGHCAADRREFVEYLPAEANSLYGKMDALSNLRFWQQLRGLRVSEAELIQELERWDLAHPLLRQNFPVERFSTGMKRRLALARVHLSKTPCWLLDEPLYGLDSRAIQTFQGILREHIAAGGQAWLVSHDTAPLGEFTLKTLDLLQENQR